VALLGISAALLYAGSFFLPAYQAGVGYQAFVVSLVFLVGIPIWLANPFFWSGLTLLAEVKYASARNAGLVALLLALSEAWPCWPGAGWFGEEQTSLSETRGAGEASRIAARFAAARPPFLPPVGQDAYWGRDRAR
jgi:hypothetical protein